MDKQWKEYTHDQYNGTPMYNGNGFGMDEYGYSNGIASKSNSLHKNYRGSQERGGHPYHREEYHGHNGSSQYHPSLDRRHYEQQHHTHQSRRSHHDPNEVNDRHAAGGKFGHQPQYAHQMQPDFYFMPHQRKYSSDVVRVFVDYDAN